MVNLEKLRSLNDAFTNMMRQIFLTPASSGEDHNDLTWAQRKIMMTIDACGPQKMSDLARQISVTMSGATAVVDKLVQAELVTRELSPHDRRVVLIELSSKGRKLLAENAKTQERCFEAVLDRLSPEKQEVLLESFERIHGILLELQTCDAAMDNKADEAVGNGR